MDTMLKPQIIDPVCSPWAFLVVISRKKNCQPCFCTECIVLNERIKGGESPIPNVEETTDDMSGATVPTKPDMLARYYQISFAKH